MNWTLILAGTGLLGVGWWVASLGGSGSITSGPLFDGLATGVESMDRPELRGRIAYWTQQLFGGDLRLGRALVAILHNESLGDPANYLGDTSISKCPSIGPLQVCRATAVQYGLWPDSADSRDREAYAALADNEALGIMWGAQVFAAKFQEAGGDVGVALRMYNGSGPMAVAYAARALQWAQSTWGEPIA